MPRNLSKQNIFKLGVKEFIFFIIWPFIALIRAIRGFEKPQNKVIVYLFCILFGFTFILGNKSMDSFRYAEKLKETAELPFNQFYNIVVGLYATDTNLDIMMPLVNFIISRITADYRVLFGIWAMIFGFFYIKSIGNLYEMYITNKNLSTLLFLLLFIILNPISNINGFRMYTGAWVFYFGAFQVLINNNKKYIFLALASVLFHFSFISASLIFLLHIFLGNRNWLFYILLIASFVIPEISIGYIEPFARLIGEGVADKAARYASDYNIQAIAAMRTSAIERGAWYLYVPGTVLKYYIITAFFYFRFKFKLLPEDQNLQNLFSFSLLFLAFANFVSPIPSMGRFFTVFYLFAGTYIIMVAAKYQYSRFNLLTIAGIVTFVLLFIVQFRVLSDVLNPWLFGPLPMPFLINDVSVYQLIFE